MRGVAMRVAISSVNLVPRLRNFTDNVDIFHCIVRGLEASMKQSVICFKFLEHE